MTSFIFATSSPYLTSLPLLSSHSSFLHMCPWSKDHHSSILSHNHPAIFPFISLQGHRTVLSLFFIIGSTNHTSNIQGGIQHSIRWYIIWITNCDHPSFLLLHCVWSVRELHTHFVSNLYRCNTFHLKLLLHYVQVSPFVQEYDLLQKWLFGLL